MEYATLSLSGILDGDVVTVAPGSVTYDLNLDDNAGFEQTGLTAADARAALQAKASTCGMYGVRVNFVAPTLAGADSANYSLPADTVSTPDSGDNVVVFTVNPRPVSGGGGGGFAAAPATYDIVSGTGVSADKTSAKANTTITLTVAEGYNTPVVKASNGKTVELKTSGSKYTFKMPASDVTVTVTSEAPGYLTCPKDDTCVLEKFTDLKNTYWYHDGIHYCLENGVMNGVSEDTFAPNASTTRGMIMTMLARLSGVVINCNNGKWYLPGMEWAVANGVSDGTMPTENVTREQLAVMLYRYAVEIAKVDVAKLTADASVKTYSDADTIRSWAKEGVDFCTATGVLGGYVDGTLCPRAEATRAEVATMFLRFCENVLDK